MPCTVESVDGVSWSVSPNLSKSRWHLSMLVRVTPPPPPPPPTKHFLIAPWARRREFGVVARLTKGLSEDQLWVGIRINNHQKRPDTTYFYSYFSSLHNDIHLYLVYAIYVLCYHIIKTPWCHLAPTLHLRRKSDPQYWYCMFDTRNSLGASSWPPPSTLGL